MKIQDRIKLIASSPSIEGIMKLAQEYFCSPINIQDNKVFNSKGEILNFNIRLLGNRYRLEYTNQEVKSC